MPKWSGEADTRGAKAKAAKADAAASRKAVDDKRRAAAEDAAWTDGADVRGAKRREEAAAAAAEREARKREKAALLAREEAEAARMKLKGAEKVAVGRSHALSSSLVAAATGAKTVAASGGAGAVEVDRTRMVEISARGLDAALAAVSLATGSSRGGDTAGGGGGADADSDGEAAAAMERELAADAARLTAIAAAHATGGIVKVDDRHPERRMRAAFARFEERETAVVREENPSLRRSQVREVVWRRWLKSKENPMNVEHSAYDARR
jgi:hypothetical protein